ncbi:class III poly(R)-hydroxyalkanoic acid synthase subunit PhaC [Methylocaldum sp.]|uniref:class III poly(R)-hydroxyalkanoic acid synthase subunit PhaC n=1 Tax=Methylocaldum sp. TaxID=1969727 RepID=UPI002D501D01|nr:class III poly(R)-hydroxyalkanoic acid synthase subunit PhaC [Methylocaldum sp.]HYE37770.1 class III poly(R)-hydroxyalkanoic acid synthase subunit PhaC [Methylocaldum sp.]
MLRPDQIAQELFEFNRRVANGMVTLSKIGGVEVEASPKDPVYHEDKLVLYRYRPQREKTSTVPLLIVYALVNRPYMTDLQADRSIVRGLLDQGVDVYLVDWGYPDGADRFLDLEDYVNRYIRRCVEFVCKQHDLPSINVLGICQGGTLSLCYSALHPERVRNLITMVTPVDFHTPDNTLSLWYRDLDVDLMVDTLGNIPGELLNWSFLSLKPFRLTGQKYIDMADILEDEDKLKNFLRMEKWIFDSPDQPGELFRQFTKQFYQENRLVKGTVEIGGRTVDLKNIKMPVLNVYATEDHLVPPSASIPLEKYVGTNDYSTIVFRGGHIGIYVSSRSQKDIPPAIAEWLKARSQ